MKLDMILTHSERRLKMPEEVIGKIVGYFAKIGVAAIEMEGVLKVGDTIHFKGHTTDFTQTVESMQIENEPKEEVKSGDSVGMKVQDRVRPHDVVYKVTEEE